MQDVLRAFGLAIAGIFHPRMLWMTIRPFIFAGILWSFILWFSWDPLLGWAKDFLTNSIFTSWIQELMNQSGWDQARAVITPFFVVVILMPLIIISLLVIVSFTSVEGVVKHIEKQKAYEGLKALKGGNLWGSFFYSLWSTLMCLFFMLITLPVWWIPPIFAIIPPIIWGWLTMRLMSYDVLARHASVEEREYLLEKYRLPLLGMGIVAGILGAVPSFFWVSSIFVLVLFPVVSLVMMWMYALVFVFAALWFGHYLLFVLRLKRQLGGEF